MWSFWNQALQARCCVRACAVALMMMSLKDTLPWSPSCLFRASRASLARSMSTSMVRKKWGMGPREVPSRFAMVLRIWVSGTSSYAAPPRVTTGGRGAGAGTARGGLPLGGGDLAQDAVRARHQVHHGLVGFDLGQCLARLHGVSVPLVPLHHAPFLHGGRERFHVDVGGHGDQSR